MVIWHVQALLLHTGHALGTTVCRCCSIRHALWALPCVCNLPCSKSLPFCARRASCVMVDCLCLCAAACTAVQMQRVQCGRMAACMPFLMDSPCAPCGSYGCKTHTCAWFGHSCCIVGRPTLGESPGAAHRQCDYGVVRCKCCSVGAVPQGYTVQ